MKVSSPQRRRFPGSSLSIALAVLLTVGSGCSNRELNRPPLNLIGKPWANACDPAPAVDGDTEAVAGLSAVLAGQPPPQVPGRPLNLLVISGGGKYGAFTAGQLNGWTVHGDRPVFDVATGVSSGAIIATLAFLGPKYDQKMAGYFLALKRENIYSWQIIGGLRSRMGVMNSEPMQRTLEGAIDAEFLCDLRAAHESGRRLYVGTSEVQSNRPVVWDLGAIACSGRPDSRDLIIKILTAACTPPGIVQPIKIDVEVNGVHYTELHADGGNMLQAFVRTPAGIPPGSQVWALSAGKYYRNPPEGPPRIRKLIGGAVSNSLYALFRSDLMKLYGLCAATKSQFHLMALPQDFPISASAFGFDSEELVRLYNQGYQMTASGTEWRSAPPDTLPGEATPPRTGTKFISP